MKTIVLIDDDAAIREAFTLMLRTDKFRVIALPDGREVLTEQVTTPDLFVIDRHLSGMNGLDICRFIKGSEKYKKILVFIFSAVPDDVGIYKAVGADCFIAKPFSVKQMREYIMRYTVDLNE
ncbi:MAG: response regulator [Agriterribacter sp.]